MMNASEEAAELGIQRTVSLVRSQGSSKLETGCNVRGWISGLQSRFGCAFLVVIMTYEHIGKGVIGSLAFRVDPYIFRAYNLPAQQTTAIKNIVMMPFVIKPAIGLISDVLPIKGYNKRPYMFMAIAMGFVGYVGVGFSSPETTPLKLVAVGLFLGTLFIATTDLMTEALAAERIQSSPECGPDLLTFIFAGVKFFSIVSVACSGPLLELLPPQRVYLFAALLTLLSILPLLLRQLEERKLTKADVREARRRFWEQREILTLIVIICAGSILTSGTALTTLSPVFNAYVHCAVALTVLLASATTLSPPIARFTAFSLIQASFTLQLESSHYYFMTDTPEEFPGGPHLSKVFYNSVLGSLANVFSLGGLLVYRRFSGGIKYRYILLGTNTVAAVLHFADAVLYARLNLKLGIPDRAFVLGNAALHQVLSQWQWMPQVAIFAQLCPKGMESTMFALVLACHNMGHRVGASLGALLLHFLDCNPRGLPNEGEQFKNLWLAAVISGLVILFITLAFFWLVPGFKPGEHAEIHAEDATSGSLFKRCTDCVDNESEEESNESKEDSVTESTDDEENMEQVALQKTESMRSPHLVPL